MPACPAAAAAARTDSMGISSWRETTEAAAMVSFAAATSCGVRAALAPGETTMLLSPSGSTRIMAVPVRAASSTITGVTSVPASRWAPSSSSP